MRNLLELLKNNSYPGRGIVVGRNKAFYFIMGRSENSRYFTHDGGVVYC